MGKLQEINPGNKSAPGSSEEKTHIYDDEIRLIDYLRILWKQKYFIILGSVLPVLIAGLVIYLLPRNYEVTYTYDMNITKKGSKTLLDKFYSQENLNRIIVELKQNSLDEYAQKISKANTINLLKKLISFEVISNFSENNEALRTTGINNTDQNRTYTGELLILTITGYPLKNIPKISSIIRENFENTIPMYSAKHELNSTIISLKIDMADIEKNRFNLELELKTKKSILAKLKGLKPDDTTDIANDVILQFDNVGENSEYLPLAYQIQATDANIINIEETIKTNQEKYNYYDGLLSLNKKIFDNITKKNSPYYTIQQFHSFLESLVNDYTNKEQVDYLNAYTKKIENTISINTPIIEEPKIYPVPKGLMKKCSVVFAISLIVITFIAFLSEAVDKGRT